MNISRKVATAVACCAMAGATAGAGCGGEDDSGGDGGSSTADATATKDAKVLLSFHKSIYWLPLLVAEGQGYFDEEGIDLEIEEASGSGFVTQQVIAGNADWGWAGAADDVIAFSKDDSLRALSCNPPRNIFLITVPEDSDIQSVADLDGKTLGFTEAGGGEEPLVNAALAEAGLERNADVKVLPIGAAGPQSLDAIQSGQVDAYASSYPDISSLRADGAALRDITPEQYAAIPGDCLLTTDAVLADDAKREVGVGMARAWAKGALFAQTNPAAALEIACEAVPEECQNKAYAEQYLNDTVEFSKTPGEPDAPFGVVPVAAWQATADLLTGAGTISEAIDAATLAGGPEVESFQTEYTTFDRAAVVAQAEEYGAG